MPANPVFYCLESSGPGNAWPPLRAHRCCPTPATALTAPPGPCCGPPAWMRQGRPPSGGPGSGSKWDLWRVCTAAATAAVPTGRDLLPPTRRHRPQRCRDGPSRMRTRNGQRLPARPGTRSQLKRWAGAGACALQRTRGGEALPVPGRGVPSRSAP